MSVSIAVSSVHESCEIRCDLIGKRVDERTSKAGVKEFGLHLLQGNQAFAEHLAAHQVEALPAGVKLGDVLRRCVTAGPEDAFYVCDLGVILRKVNEWQRLLPRVRPHYAVKCNPEPFIVKALALAGLGFDCASKAEILLALDSGVVPEDIIYANPCKQASTIRTARARGVNQMTFDNPAELQKIQLINPDAELFVRLAVDDSQSICRFNSKFGVRPEDCGNLLEEAKKLGLNVVGVSFHVGSGCKSADAFRGAVESARQVFDLATDLGFNMQVLDLGGGFPGHDYGSLTFEDIATTLAGAIDDHFPPERGVTIIAEPGRYFVSESHTLATCIIAKRPLVDEQLAEAPAEVLLVDDKSTQEADIAYYMNDGVYGSFNCVVFDHALVTPFPLSERVGRRVRPSKLFGPTCDSMDLVLKSVPMLECEVGDWLYWPNMGAYTRSAASQFNGFEVPSCKFVLSVDGLGSSLS